MNYYNINYPKQVVSLKEAVLKSIQHEEGLFMPIDIPRMPDSFFEKLSTLTLTEMAFEVAKAMFGEDIEEEALKHIVNHALSFRIPLKKIDEDLFVLELFHGPTMAFKDVGARFMAGLFEYFMKSSSDEVTILVATSGDTGGAVANAFYNKKGIKVIILYPSGNVSLLQEKQLTTLGANITALEVHGDFDDCQHMVKQAFMDTELNQKMQLTSANSINFARLFPQSFYYFYAYAQLNKPSKPVCICVPSGNFGNLTAGLIAKRMGLPISYFIAATNSNHVVPSFLQNGTYEPQATVHTISNAMDVGKPSNFSRMMALYQHKHEAIIEDVKGFWCDDEVTKKTMKYLMDTYAYQADPHGAVAFAALQAFPSPNEISIFVETAHPVKFPESVEEASGKAVLIPDELIYLNEKSKVSIQIENQYEALRNYLMQS